MTYYIGAFRNYARPWGDVRRGGGGGSETLVQFHCILHAKKGGGAQIAYKDVYVIIAMTVVVTHSAFV